MSYFEKRAEGKSPKEAEAEMPEYRAPKITAKHVFASLVIAITFMLVTD